MFLSLEIITVMVIMCIITWYYSAVGCYNCYVARRAVTFWLWRTTTVSWCFWPPMCRENSGKMQQTKRKKKRDAERCKGIAIKMSIWEIQHLLISLHRNDICVSVYFCFDHKHKINLRRLMIPPPSSFPLSDREKPSMNKNNHKMTRWWC